MMKSAKSFLKHQETHMTKIRNITLINGPNLNFLGKRKENIYGKTTLAEIEKKAKAVASELKLKLTCLQSNSEGAIVDAIQAAHKSADAIIINAGAYSHTSIAIADALADFGKPVIEVHISNIYAREEYRHHSFVSEHAVGVIAGLGPYGYEAAIYALANQ